MGNCLSSPKTQHMRKVKGDEGPIKVFAPSASNRQVTNPAAESTGNKSSTKNGEIPPKRDALQTHPASPPRKAHQHHQPDSGESGVQTPPSRKQKKKELLMGNSPSTPPPPPPAFDLQKNHLDYSPTTTATSSATGTPLGRATMVDLDDSLLDTTMPLTPASVAEEDKNLQSSPPKTPQHQLQPPPQPLLDILASPNASFLANKSNIVKNTRQGRALQARLQKARQLQQASAAVAAGDYNMDSADPNNSHHRRHTSSSSSIPDVFLPAETEPTGLHSAAAPYYTMGDDDASSRAENEAQQQQRNKDFEASLNQSMIWAEAGIGGRDDDSVLAVALSRQQPTLDCTTPPLYMAMGTAKGRLIVRELQIDKMEESDPGARPTDQRLGAVVSWRREGGAAGGGQRLRCVDFLPSIASPGSAGSCVLACAGDDGICVLLRLEESDEEDAESVLLSSLLDDASERQSQQPEAGQPSSPEKKKRKRLRVLAEVPRVDRIYAISFSPDGQYLAIGGYDETVAIVQVEASNSTVEQGAEVVAEIPVGPECGLISALSWSPDGTMLAMGGSGKICTLVDTTSWQVLHDIRRPAAITCIQWHPAHRDTNDNSQQQQRHRRNRNDRHQLAIGCSINVVVLDPMTLQLIKEIAFYAEDGTRKHSNQSSSLPTSAANPNARTGNARIMDLCWSPLVGKYLVVVCGGSGGDKAHFAKLMETKTFSTIQEIYRGGGDAVVSSDKTISSSNHSSSGGPSTQVCCLAWGHLKSIMSSGLDGPSRQFLVIGSDKKVVVFKAGAGMEGGGSTASSSSIGAAGDEDASSAASSSYFSNRGAGVELDWVWKEGGFQDADAVGAAGKEKTEHQQPVPTSLTADNLILAGDPPHTVGPTCNVLTVAFSRGSKSRPSAFFATALDNGIVTVRSTVSQQSGSDGDQNNEQQADGDEALEDWRVLCQLEFLDPVTCIAFSNGSRFMACGGAGKVRMVATAPVWTVVTVIDVQVHLESTTYHRPPSSIVGLGFSKNNERLAIVASDGVLSFVDPQNHFRLCGELTGVVAVLSDTPDETASRRVTAMDWSSKFLAVGQEDGIVSIYRVTEILQHQDGASAPPIFTTTTAPSAVRTLALGPSSRFLAVGGENGNVSVFSRAAAPPSPSLPPHGGDWACVHSFAVEFSIASLKWSPLGNHVAVAGQMPARAGSGFKKAMKVIDTVFWADVKGLHKESSEPTTPPRTTSGNNHVPHLKDDDDDDLLLSLSSSETFGGVVMNPNSSASVAFSQNGKFMAFTDHQSCVDGSARIVDTDAWDVVLDIHPEQEANRASSPAFSDTNSSLSSPPPALDDNNQNDVPAAGGYGNNEF